LRRSLAAPRAGQPIAGTAARRFNVRVNVRGMHLKHVSFRLVANRISQDGTGTIHSCIKE
jgi:hypothetical protein